MREEFAVLDIHRDRVDIAPVNASNPDHLTVGNDGKWTVILIEDYELFESGDTDFVWVKRSNTQVLRPATEEEKYPENEVWFGEHFVDIDDYVVWKSSQAWATQTEKED